MWRRNHSKPKPQASDDVTVVLCVEDPAGVGLSLSLVAGYVERFGVRCEKVRVTNRDDDGARTTWISMTLGAMTDPSMQPCSLTDNVVPPFIAPFTWPLM